MPVVDILCIKADYFITLCYTPLKQLKPPSMGSTVPVMKLAASEQRN